MMDNHLLHYKLNKTFGRRIGKSLSNIQKYFIENNLPKHIFVPNEFSINKYDKVFLEIGFGMGEHFISQMSLYPDALFIGCEVYLNGVANTLRLAEEQNLSNFLIWPDDVDMILDNLPSSSLDGIYILFPDPWHKRRYIKKRIMNIERLNIFKTKLKHQGILIFSSDIEDYFESAKNIINNDSELSIKRLNFDVPHKGYIKTKYHQKAEESNRIPRFLEAVYRVI